MERSTAVGRLDVGALKVFSVLGVLSAGGALVWGIFAFVDMLTSANVPVTQPVRVDVTDIATNGPASVVSGAASSADVVLSGLSLGSRLLLGSGTLLLALVQMMIAIAVVVLCRQLLAGRPFVRSLRRLLSVLAVVVLAGGMIGQALYGFGNFQVASELNDDPGGTAFPMMMHLDSTPFIVGVVLALLATAFTVGERLQRETDGLV